MHFTFNNNCPKEDITDFIQEWQSDSPYFQTQTSGSTGNPKTILIEKKHALASALATINFFKLTPKSKAVLCLNPKTIGGKMMMVRALTNKMDLLCIRPQANPLLDINDVYDFIAIAPIQLATIIDQCPEKLVKIKNIIVGGGIIADTYIQKLKNLKISVYQTFGMTETISHIALRKVGFDHQNEYHTLPSITVSQNKEKDTLIIHAPQLGHPHLETNDIVKLINETSFSWIGRADFTINSGGIKVQIEELENQLQNLITHPFFIWFQQHDQLGQEIILVIEGEIKPEWKQKKTYTIIPNYHIPKKIVNIDKFDRSASDKIQRKSSFEQYITTDELQPIL